MRCELPPSPAGRSGGGAAGGGATGGGGAVDATGGGGSTGASSSVGIVTVSAAPSLSTLMVVDHAFFCGALALTVCEPGSTGMATPTSAFCTSAPSRLIARPSSAGATMVSRASFGASAAARFSAVFWFSARPAALAALAASLYVAHALAVRPAVS